ncbi:molecular chaperone DnaK [Verrucomicrobiaceae bacterium SCGC AG-212-N21]|nr:molecular chaperone DnaK [Verrucomicrobiaceae bacterium SCGC AG-212-N21]
MSAILGIDLGTTNSLVGVVDSGFPILLADADGSRLTPSAVCYHANGSITVGAAAQRQRALQSDRVVTSVKRLIGRREGESEWQPAYDLKTVGKTPVEVSADILRHLKQIAERALETEVSRAVITVPAYFNDAQRNATKRAGELAGLTVERILSEPTAAALAYGLDKLEEHRKIAVFDLGGGTFDISILEMRDGVFQVLSTAGDTQLGGDDIDRAFANWLLERSVDTPVRPQSKLLPQQQTRLTAAAEEAKKKLSSDESVQIDLPFFDGQHSISVRATRADLETVAQPIVERTRKHCFRALSDARIKEGDLDEIIVVGGSTRMPLVRKMAQDIFGRQPNTSQNPDEAIALGAVIQAGILSGALRNVVLLDVTPLSLGIETFGGLMNIIIPRNSTIPCKAGEMFTNAVANQEEMLIRVLQGERELAKDNWELGRIAVPFPKGAKGSARVGVQFSLDANGILQVLARDTATNQDTVLEIQSSAVDVDDARVEQMIAESVDFAFEDMNERIWTEARLKSTELLGAVQEALTLCGDLLTSEEQESIRKCETSVQQVMDAEPHDARALKAANQALDDATQSLAVLLIERAMEQALERKLNS